MPAPPLVASCPEALHAARNRAIQQAATRQLQSLQEAELAELRRLSEQAAEEARVAARRRAEEEAGKLYFDKNGTAVVVQQLQEKLSADIGERYALLQQRLARLEEAIQTRTTPAASGAASPNSVSLPPK
jgi:flagellar motility protein MotE (MotC chaperone)